MLCDGQVFTLVGVLCASSSRTPLGLARLWILISTCLLAVNFGPRPLRLITVSSAHVQPAYTGPSDQSLHDTACPGEHCDPSCISYTRDQLSAIPPARLIPDVTSRLGELDTGFIYHASALSVVVRT